MAIFELPLQTGSQEFYTTLNGKTYKLRLIWRDPIGWFLDIHDVADLPLAIGINP